MYDSSISGNQNVSSSSIQYHSLNVGYGCLLLHPQFIGVHSISFTHSANCIGLNLSGLCIILCQFMNTILQYAEWVYFILIRYRDSIISFNWFDTSNHCFISLLYGQWLSHDDVYIYECSIGFTAITIWYKIKLFRTMYHASYSTIASLVRVQQLILWLLSLYQEREEKRM